MGDTSVPATRSPDRAEEETAAPADTPIEVDLTDADSAYVDQFSTFTESLSSSVLNYPTEHGRRYHAFRSGAYPMPNDEAESDRLDLTHGLITKGTGDQLYHAPIDEATVSKILDIGTGTGIWAITIGDQLPGAEVLGNDLSAIQPSWVPPNVKFEIDDVESPWVYNAPFDFIFCRYMAASIKNWPKLVKNIYDNTASGGWAEFQDFDFQYYSDDGSLKADCSTMKYLELLLGAARKTGREPSPGPHLEGWVKEAGFQNIVHKKFRFPIGPWPKDRHLKTVGMYNLAQLLDGLEGFTLRLFCDVLGWDEKEVVVLLAKVRAEVKDPSLHAQYNFHVVYAQKP